jgi:hypothetical protein
MTRSGEEKERRLQANALLMLSVHIACEAERAGRDCTAFDALAD